MEDPRADILLLQPPGWAVQTPPLGLALLKSHLSGQGLSVGVLDLNILLYSLRQGAFQDSWEPSNGYYTWERPSFVQDLFAAYSLELHDALCDLLLRRPAAVGISVHCSSFIAGRMLAERIKKLVPETHVVFGGPHMARYTSHSKELLAQGLADAVVFGEAEESLAEYLRMRRAGETRPVAGAAYRRPGGEILDGGERPLIRSLDALPFPDFSDFDLRLYKDRGALPTYFSRGCINRCAYCTENRFFPKFRNRSGERVFAEVRHLLRTHPGTESFRMHDSVCNGDIRQLERFCDLLIESGTGTRFNLENAVVRKEMDARLCRKLRRAGCTVVGYGLETPSKRLLAAIGKRACLDADFDRVVEDGVDAGLTVGINMMFGLPGERDEDFQAQLDFLARHRARAGSMLVNPALNSCYFPEGSLVHDQPEKYGVDMSLGELHWTSADGTNTFPSRLDKFERFCRRAAELGYENIFDVLHSANRSEQLGSYYRKLGRAQDALAHLLKSFDEEVPTMELVEDIFALADAGAALAPADRARLEDYRRAQSRRRTPLETATTQAASLDELLGVLGRIPVREAARRAPSTEDAAPPAGAPLKQRVRHLLAAPALRHESRRLGVALALRHARNAAAARRRPLPDEALSLCRDLIDAPAPPRLSASARDVLRHAAFTLKLASMRSASRAEDALRALESALS